MFKKIFIIGAALFLLKVVLMIYPYFMSKEQYYYFNKSYFTASIIIILSTFGFNISQTKIPLDKYFLLLLVFIHTIIFTLFFMIIKSHFYIIDFVSIVLYSVPIAYIGILNFQRIFYGNYKKYFYVTLSLAITHLLIIFFKSYKNQFFVLSVFVFIWFVFIINYFENVKEIEFNYKEYYKIGYSAMITNSAVSLVLAGDKYIANHHFETNIANSYSFAWMIIAPLFYIGNVIEKFLFTEGNYNPGKILRKGILLSLLIVSCYNLIIFSIINFSPRILPATVSPRLFTKIYVLMALGYSIFVTFYFPLNTYLYKFCKTDSFKKIGVNFTIILALYAIIFLIINSTSINFNYTHLLSLIFFFVFALLSTKTLLVFKDNFTNATVD